jgi:hypothetical protein
MKLALRILGLAVAVGLAGCSAGGVNGPVPGDPAPSLGVGKAYTILMPTRALTPGKADTVSLAVICGTTTQSRRNVTEATKAKVFKEYGITTRVGYEVDHLIPLAIGGSNDITNLWPQPATPVPGFHQKDLLEVKLHTLVCSGKLDAKKAQGQVATDWSAAYFRYVK